MKKKIGAFRAGQFSLGTLVGGRPGTTIFQTPGGGGGWGVSHTRTGPSRPPPGVQWSINNHFRIRCGQRRNTADSRRNMETQTQKMYKNPANIEHMVWGPSGKVGVRQRRKPVKQIWYLLHALHPLSLVVQLVTKLVRLPRRIRQFSP